MSNNTPDLPPQTTKDLGYGTNSFSKPKPKRRKTARACQHCHKTHMTCDEGRPCKRCVIRGLQDTCIDAPRKKKKYLMDVPENLEAPTIQPASNSTTNSAEPQTQSNIKQEFNFNNINHDLYNQPIASKNDPSFEHQHHQHQQSFPNQNNIMPANLPQKSSKFMSNAANNEYSILSDIIKQDYNFYNANISESTVSPPNNHNYDMNNSILKLRHSSGHSIGSRNSTPTPNSTSSMSQHDLYHAHKQSDKTINQYKLGIIQEQIITYPEVMKVLDGEMAISDANQPTLSKKENLNKPALSFSIAINENSESNSPTLETSNGLRFKEPEDIYAKIDRPFSYTPGFHSLIQYLRQRFNAKDLIKMAKSMASYRPSFIACTNTLKEEDLIFMEQCFQRTLLEYDKFISISGTPTIVWRRTGQISYVSEEFSILTGWAKDNLLNKVTFIVELMDDSSVIEYFDLFSTIAYGDFKAATMGSCTLLTPDNSRIKTTCIWTLKRDVFGIPMMIIGNFLPIL